MPYRQKYEFLVVAAAHARVKYDVVDDAALIHDAGVEWTITLATCEQRSGDWLRLVVCQLATLAMRQLIIIYDFTD